MKKIVILLLSALLISACGYMTGTLQKSETSFLVFSGNLENVSVQIDDRPSFFPANGKHYQVSPGKHNILAYRDGKLLLNRVVILENQITTEINVP